MPTDNLKQRLAAVMAADVAGFSRLMSENERGTIQALELARGSFRRVVEAHGGRVVDTAGDSVLACFESANGAMAAALAVQVELAEGAAAVPEAVRMRFRIGLHLGDVMHMPDGSIYGEGVNIAARLQELAEPGGTAISEAVCGVVRGKFAATFEDLGERRMKNIFAPVRVFRVWPGEHADTGAPALGSLAPSVQGSAVARTVVDMNAPVPGFGGRPAIAVLPFDNLSGDPEQAFFADGLSEDILTRLAKGRWLPVIARSSSFAFKGRSIDAKEAGRLLGARYVLEGSVRRAGNRVRVTGQLIDAISGHQIWADRYDRVLEDLFAIQDELTDGITGALGGALGRAEVERVRTKAPSNLSAWELFQRGVWHQQRLTREEFEVAEPLFRRATELDPTLAAAHSALAWQRMMSALFLWTDKPAQAFADSMTSASAALAADPMEAFAYAVMGNVMTFSHRHDEALSHCRKGIELNPSHAASYYVLAATHLFRGEVQEMILAAETAVRLSPHDVTLHISLGMLSAGHYLQRDYERALELARLTVERGPAYPSGWRLLTIALGQLGRVAEARAALARMLEFMPQFVSETAARATLPFRDEAVFQHYIEGLRKAGWQG